MKWYDVTYTETVTFRTSIEAESESAVRQAFIDYDVPAGEAIDWANSEIVSIEEIE